MTHFGALREALPQGGVEFIIVGGSPTAHGASRLALDLDMAYERLWESILRMVSALGRYHPCLGGALAGLPFRWEAATMPSGLDSTLATDMAPVDILGRAANGGWYNRLVHGTIYIELYGVRFRCLAIWRSIEVERAVGRPEQIEPVAELEAPLEEMEKEQGRFYGCGMRTSRAGKGTPPVGCFLTAACAMFRGGRSPGGATHGGYRA